MSKPLLIVMLGAALFATQLDARATVRADSWQFDVYLDDRKIGYHKFDVSEERGQTRVDSEAQFDVRFLFITAFRYKHVNTERWDNDCLHAIEAKTRANGKRIAVEGEKTADGFTVRDGERVRQLPDCVMSFAYWNPDFLTQTRLLNPQTGEYLTVTVEELEPQTLEVRGDPVAARPFRVTAKDVELTVWYSTKRQWLALESVTNGGRIIRYELT